MTDASKLTPETALQAAQHLQELYDHGPYWLQVHPSRLLMAQQIANRLRDTHGITVQVRKSTDAQHNPSEWCMGYVKETP